MTPGPAQAVGPSSTVTVPQHVVFRAFLEETVVLNVKTGQYHGLNATAGRMLELLREGRTVADAATTLAEEFDAPAEVITADITALCRDLLERQLIEVGAPAP